MKRMSDEEIQELLDNEHTEIYSSYNCDILLVDDLRKRKNVEVIPKKKSLKDRWLNLFV